jgi:hypothetical protein
LVGKGTSTDFCPQLKQIDVQADLDSSNERWLANGHLPKSFVRRLIFYQLVSQETHFALTLLFAQGLAVMLGGVAPRCIHQWDVHRNFEAIRVKVVHVGKAYPNGRGSDCQHHRADMTTYIVTSKPSAKSFLDFM